MKFNESFFQRSFLILIFNFNLSSSFFFFTSIYFKFLIHGAHIPSKLLFIEINYKEPWSMQQALQT